VWQPVEGGCGSLLKVGVAVCGLEGGCGSLLECVAVEKVFCESLKQATLGGCGYSDSLPTP
jgi:hypothetical protein